MVLERGCLPDSMLKAHIVLILKQGKLPTVPNSYRPISLLPVDVKILGKIVARRLNKCNKSIIHPGLSCFMPLKSTAINIRRVHLNMQTQADNSAYHQGLKYQMEWPYLWQTLRLFGFGDIFISWVQLLYPAPMASIRERGRISQAFSLGRGMRQGCPLSTILFALFIKTLAAMEREDDRIVGLEYGEFREKITLYTDDMLFFLGDTDASL